MESSNSRAAFATADLDVGSLALPWLSATEGTENNMCCAEMAQRAGDGAVLLTFTYDPQRRVLACSQEVMATLFAAVRAGEAVGVTLRVAAGATVTVAGFGFVTSGEKVRMYLVGDPDQSAYADADELDKLLTKIPEGRFDDYVATRPTVGAVV